MQVQSVNTALTPPLQNESAPQQRAQLAAAETSKVSAEAVKVSSDAVQASRATADSGDVKKAVEKLNQTVTSFNRSLQFSVDEDTKMNIVKLVDVDSKEVIRQIPSEEVLSIAKAIDKLQGMLIEEKA
ncbi:flagellar protein FlaG [Chitinimonas lacunae]|uniref:Flagellar protein FlaG n=1 Tax=Chitinimonas lacunae TaxID=1963018 RepID=A0ABV8MWB4_9NEIS